jgi:hypothetical protein
LIGAAFSPTGASRASDEESSAARQIEVRRIRTHFDSVLGELEGRDVAALTAPQRAQRASLLATLRAYRDRGVFPHNYDFPGEAVPYFVDRETGTLCAVAHLLASTGRRDIVDRVARADNNVRVAQLAGDTAFGNWLDVHGLTLAEAARIQVPYVVDDPPASRSANARSTPAALPLTAGLSLGAATWNAFLNADGHSRLANAIGVGSGLLAIGVGAAQAGQPNVSRAASVTTAAVGGLGVALSVRSIHRHNVIAAAEREAARKSKVADATITPIIPVAGSGAGVSVSFRF